MLDFLITDKNICNSFYHSNDEEIREKLLIHESEDDISLSLYLDKEIIIHLCEDDPVKEIHPGNIDDACLALEGISHFVYLVWNAKYHRSVSLLEMELQAEVDKFIMISTWLNQQNETNYLENLPVFLFENITYHDSLSQDELQRYKDANFYAAKYCTKLQKIYYGKKYEQELLNEVRGFYRMTRGSKIQRINKI